MLPRREEEAEGYCAPVGTLRVGEVAHVPLSGSKDVRNQRPPEGAWMLLDDVADCCLKGDAGPKPVKVASAGNLPGRWGARSRRPMPGD
ncbi:hypothetical protein [Methylobacterium bullatum]|uniref:hypothetical protein n=1 Tax=Methylobacterium bullatum TaxID=570505 RepID=UPI0030CDAECB